jgi:WD40 repeat protein
MSRLHAGAAVRDLDMSPSNPQIVASAGDDGSIRLSDLRKPSEALTASRTVAHAHALGAAACRFSPLSERVLASGGADGRVALWDTHAKAFAQSESVLQLRGAPLQETALVAERSEVQEQRLSCVYSLAWSAKDKGTCCALSYDGRLVLVSVPQSLKYSLLL